MKPSPLSRFGAAADLRAAIRTASPVIDAPRDLSDPAGLRGLLELAEGILKWVAQFERGSPVTAIAANAIGHRGICKALGFVGDELQRHAPIAAKKVDIDAAADSAVARPEGDGLRQLRGTLNYFNFLAAAVGGRHELIPEYEYPYEDLPDATDWCESWEPADEENSLLAHQWFHRLRKAGSGRNAEIVVHKVHERIGRVAREAVAELAGELESEACPFGFPRVREQLDAKRNAAAKAACMKFGRVTRQLVAVVGEVEIEDSVLPFGSPHQEFFIATLAEKFVAAGHAYVNACLKVLPLGRSERQNERNKLLRRIGNVAQYAHLASGNGRFLRFGQLIDYIGVFGEALREDVEKAGSGIGGLVVDGRSSQEIVQTLNRLVIEPAALKRWRDRLGSESARIGSIVEAIVADDPLQDPPWTPGDKVPAISGRGLLRRRGKKRDGKSEEVRSALFAMQHVGLAIQAPWSYITGKQAELPRRRTKNGLAFEHKGLLWLVNPLGMVLARKDGRRPTGKVGGQRQAPKKAAVGQKRSERRTHAPQSDRRKRGANQLAATGARALIAKRRPKKPSS